MAAGRTFFLVLVLSVVFTACGGDGADGPGDRRGMGVTPAVEVVQARAGSLPLEQRLSGVVEARNQVSIYPDLSGRIEAVFADNGDRVRQGQPLARIEARQFEEQLRQAEADLRVQQAATEQARARLRQAEADLRRTETLAEREFVSAVELERMRAEVESARADVSRAEAVVDAAESTVAERRDALARTVIRAPVGGVVGRRDAEVGMRVDPSSELFLVGDMSLVRVRVSLTERMLRFVEPGQTVHLTSETLGDRLIEASISRISPFLAAGSFTTEATIDVPNPDGLLRAGMYVNVDVFYGETEEATLVPNSAIHEDARTGRVGVFVAPELRRTFAEPELEILSADQPLSEPTPIVFREVEVLATGRATSGVDGIQAGDWVVAVGQGLLDASPDRDVEARTRAIEWNRIVELQQLQQEDMLRLFMEKQQRMAQTPDTALGYAGHTGI